VARTHATTLQEENRIPGTPEIGCGHREITRFEVYESYLDEDYTNNRAKRLMIKN
jgi:hypothetical protein